MTMGEANGLSRVQWTQWSVATGLASLVMIITIMGFAQGIIYPRERGKLLELRVDKYEDRLDRRLISLEDKLDNIREILIRQQLKK